MKVLITGANGFVSSHLIDYILHAHPEVDVYGTVRRNSDIENLKNAVDFIEQVDVELSDSCSVDEAVRKIQPDMIFHQAAQTFVPNSWTAPYETMDTNIVGTLNVLEAVRKHSPSSFVQITGSSEEYGFVTPEECPIKESQPLRPLSPYGVSKVACDRLGYQYAKSYKMNLLITRAFNMTGPRRGVSFVDSNFAKQIVEIETGKAKTLKHGNLDAIRDYTDVRDTVRAYWLLSKKKWSGEVVNICSGKGHTVSELLDELVYMANAPINTEVDPSRMRPSDVPVLIGDNSRLKMYVDWDPKIPWRESLMDLTDYWRNKLSPKY